jgi:hypothetical protein
VSETLAAPFPAAAARAPHGADLRASPGAWPALGGDGHAPGRATPPPGGPRRPCRGSSLAIRRQEPALHGPRPPRAVHHAPVRARRGGLAARVAGRLCPHWSRVGSHRGRPPAGVEETAPGASNQPRRGVLAGTRPSPLWGFAPRAPMVPGRPCRSRGQGRPRSAVRAEGVARSPLREPNGHARRALHRWLAAPTRRPRRGRAPRRCRAHAGAERPRFPAALASPRPCQGRAPRQGAPLAVAASAPTDGRGRSSSRRYSRARARACRRGRSSPDNVIGNTRLYTKQRTQIRTIVSIRMRIRLDHILSILHTNASPLLCAFCRSVVVEKNILVLVQEQRCEDL